MSEIKLAAQARTEFGKGAARRIRRADKIPAVIYGHGTDPRHITLPGHDTMMALKGANALLEITIDGADATLVLAKDVQRDPVRQAIEHVDLVVVRRGEKVHVDVPVHVIGEAASETVVTVENATISLEVEATNIPDMIEVDIEGRPAGTQISAADLVLPAGAELAADPELLVVNITQQLAEEVEGEEETEGEAEAAAPETDDEQG
ncbi:MAG: 50S ribosomal protein L25/general stress protein Ctc [Actinomycetales bacterium]